MQYSGEAHPSESGLIDRSRNGDGAAWESLVHTYQEPVFRLAYLFLGDADEAEDIAQETFLRAYRALDNFDTARPLKPWLLSIAANLARNRRRSMGRYLAALKRLLRTEPEATGRSVEEKQARRWEAQTLWQAIQHLNPNDQQVVYLRYFLEMSTEEAAEVIGVPPGTVKSRLHRALTRLRGIIQRDFPGLQEGRQL